MAPYNQAFYRMLAETARRSARNIVPIVLSYTEPRSVIDIGCGPGTWLSVFAENGIIDFLGVDGDFVPKDMLQIPTECFVPFDLTRPYHSDRRFDLAVSLEVAEHLPRNCASALVDSLVRLAPVVLFSAAIPGQGGTEHINEQWQDHWAELFEKRDYVPVDCVRRTVWNNPDVAWWYAQNVLLYCERSYVMTNQSLAREMERANAMPLNLVHPRKLDEAVWRERLARAALQLARVIPAGTHFLLVDQGTAADAFDACGQVIPFPQIDGVYAGAPADGRAAIREMRTTWTSVSHVVLVEPAFWWLSFYSEWADYLRANSRLVLETSLLKVFEIHKV